MTTEMAYSKRKALQIIKQHGLIDVLDDNLESVIKQILKDLPAESNGYTTHSKLMTFIGELNDDL